jgi:hypothetical protein
MNITYRITQYPYVEGFYWAILIDHKQVDQGHEATRQDCLDVMSDKAHGPNKKRFVPHIEDTRWKRINVSEVNSRDFD